MEVKMVTTKNGKIISYENYNNISLLVNSPYYYMGCVFIVEMENQCRLVAIHNNRLMIDQCFPTMRGAKISFARLFRSNSWQKTMKPNWSNLYQPDIDWLSDKWEIIENSDGALIDMKIH
jgi:hypothetical protein